MAEAAAISYVLQTIGSLLLEEGKFLLGVKDQVEGLKTELKLLQGLLRGAEENEIEADTVRQWISEAKDTAYDAGDLLESYAFKIESRDGGFLKVLNRCFCILNHCYLRHKVGSEVQALNAKISNLNAKISNLKSCFSDYGVRPIIHEEGSSSRQTYPFDEEEDFVGPENDVGMLAQHLVNEDENGYYRVVSIYGMGGSGKTTLAKKVYNHPEVKRYFTGFAWICVSQQWQAKDLLQRMMIKLVPEKREEIEKVWREDDLIEQLRNVQQQRKCLIVFDDIWEKKAWDRIKNAFPIGQKGSKILLTTRNREVALHIDPYGFHHPPRLLSQGESWELLRKKAFRGRYAEGQTNTSPNEMEELGKKMVERCGGLPLAVVVLGGILATKNTVREWEVVHQNIKGYLRKGEISGQDTGEVLEILALSYKDLPGHLKPCFLYLSCFPEDTDIGVERLYQLWIAEDMVLTKDRVGEESMTEVAERYLGELGERAMVQLRLRKWPGFRRIESCRLHDLMRDLCLLKAEEQGFLKSINYSSEGEQIELIDSLTTSSGSKFRRLVMNLDAEAVCRYIPPKKEVINSLRMLQFVVSEREHLRRVRKTVKSQLRNCEMLRVLLIEGLTPDSYFPDNCTMFHQFMLPKAVGKLIHLRYLSLRGSCFFTLSSSLSDLKHLQTLDLRLRHLWRLPTNILRKMIGLKTLYLPYPLEYQSCKVRLDGLSKLEILENFDDRYFDTNDLPKLTNLRVLHVWVCRELDNLATIADLAWSSNKLQHVSITTSYDFTLNKEKGLTILKQLLNGRNIYSLCVFYGGELWKLPECESNISSRLVELCLSLEYLEGEDDAVATLENLPQLRSLTLYRFQGKEMIFHATGFPQLEILDLLNFPKLERWTVEEGSMPNLRKFWISKFPVLEMIPDGLRFITTLETVRIAGVSGKLRERIRTPDDGGEGEDFDNIRHVPSVTISDY